MKTEGGSKRCGGIGDILAGVTAVCSFWHYELGPVLASRIVKVATKRAFEKEGRSLTAPSVIKELPNAVRLIEEELLWSIWMIFSTTKKKINEKESRSEILVIYDHHVIKSSKYVSSLYFLSIVEYYIY